jgi:hypothetical protein
MAKAPMADPTFYKIERIKFTANLVTKAGQDEYNGRILQAKEDLVVIKELLAVIARLKTINANKTK